MTDISPFRRWLLRFVGRPPMETEVDEIKKATEELTVASAHLENEVRDIQSSKDPLALLVHNFRSASFRSGIRHGKVT